MPHRKQRFRPGDQVWVRERNLAIILNYIWDAGEPVSRTHLVNTSGLNKSTVGSLLAQLQSWGFVKESGVTGARPGRPGVLIDINPDVGRLIGAEIGVGFITVVLTDMKAHIVWRKQIEMTDGDLRANLKRTERLVQEAIHHASGCRLFGIGLGVPGLVNRAAGTLRLAPNLGWRDVALRDAWRQKFTVPIIVENKANAAALGEQMLGMAKRTDDFIFVSAADGLGGGIVLGGKLFGGAGGFAGEIGHMTIDPQGPLCNCGNRGCWEMFIGPKVIVERVRQKARARHTPKLIALVDGDANAIRAEHIAQAAADGDAGVLAELEQVGQYLGIGMANLINTFNPSLVVLGGMLSVLGPYLLPRAQVEVNARAMTPTRENMQIALSASGFDAYTLGCASLILREILNNPAAWQPKPAIEEHPLFEAGVL